MKFKEILESKSQKNEINEAVTGSISAMATIKKVIDKGNLKSKDKKDLQEVLEWMSKEFKIPLD